MAKNTSGRPLAAVSYITIFGTIIALFLNKERPNPFTSYHVRQALGLWLLFFASNIVISILSSWTATTASWLVFGLLILWSFISSLLGQQNNIPILSKTFQNWFKNI